MLLLEDGFVDLDYAEDCAEKLKEPGIGKFEYEENFNLFLRYIHSAWEKADAELKDTSHREQYLLFKTRQQVTGARKTECSLINYMRVARNQLNHRKKVLWISDQGDPKRGDAGSSVALGPTYLTRRTDRYAAAVLPSLYLDFVGGAAALIPVEDQYGTIPIPTEHFGPFLQNDPTNSVRETLDFYGKALVLIANEFRSK